MGNDQMPLNLKRTRKKQDNRFGLSMKQTINTLMAIVDCCFVDVVR